MSKKKNNKSKLSKKLKSEYLDLNNYTSNLWNHDNTIIINVHGIMEDKGFILDNCNILTYSEQFKTLMGNYSNCPNKNDYGTAFNYKLFKAGNDTNKILIDSHMQTSELFGNSIENMSPHLYQHNEIIFDTQLFFTFGMGSNRQNVKNAIMGILTYKDFKDITTYKRLEKCRNTGFNPYNNKTFNSYYDAVDYLHRFDNFFINSKNLESKNKKLYDSMINFIIEGELINGKRRNGVIYLSTLINKYLKFFYKDKKTNIILLSCRVNKELTKKLSSLESLFNLYDNRNNNLPSRMYSNNINEISPIRYTANWLKNNGSMPIYEKNELVYYDIIKLYLYSLLRNNIIDLDGFIAIVSNLEN